MKNQIIPIAVACTLGLVLSAQSDQRPVQNISFKDLSGNRHSLFEPKRKATVYFFIAHDCPVANSYVPEMNRIASKYGRSGMAIFSVYTEKDMGKDVAVKHHRDFSFQFPATVDPSHVIVKRLGATVTPETVVLDNKGILKYRGRIDNLYVAFGQRRPAATHRDLRAALDSIVAGKHMQLTTSKAIGCFIPTD
jgi:thiol-disulfide isomerase/thioredoxin